MSLVNGEGGIEITEDQFIRNFWIIKDTLSRNRRITPKSTIGDSFFGDKVNTYIPEETEELHRIDAYFKSECRRLQLLEEQEIVKKKMLANDNFNF